MEYSTEQIRALAERWLAGESSLSDEAALREFFAKEKELPVDLAPYRPMFGQSARAAGERSHRKLVLHIEPAAETATRQIPRRIAPLVRRIAASVAVAASVVVAIMLFVPPYASDGSDMVCVVNGVRITDPDLIALYTHEALETVDDNLRRPGETIVSELKSAAAMSRVGEMLDELTKNQ